MFQSSIPQTGHLTHSSTSDQRPVNQNAKYYRQQLELLMMGIMVPEMCWANNKFCNKEPNLLHLVGLLIYTY